MRFFGLNISRADSDVTSLGLAGPVQKDLITHLPPVRGQWVTVGRSGGELSAGSWQRAFTSMSASDAMNYSTVWACVTLIASDIAKLWVNLMAADADGVCTPVENAAYSPVLRKPNRFSTWVKFCEYWILSKLTNGNTYVLKERDGRGVVRALYILDPSRVTPMVAPDGGVYYQLRTDPLSGLTVDVVAPASEIIHDVMVPLYHPLCGVTPLYSLAVTVMKGLRIEQNSERFFENNSQPGGVLTAPGAISNEVAERVKKHWEDNYAGQNNVGKVAVLGDGLTYEPMAVTAKDAELVAQLKFTSEMVCSAYHVPAYMVGIGPMPPYNNIQTLTIQYYQQALQNPIENLETLLTEGLELSKPYSIEFDLDALWRMDTATAIDSATKGITGGLFKPDEGRRKFNLPKVEGGDAVYLQQQNYSLAALAKRDASEDPFATAKPATPPAPSPADPPVDAVDQADAEAAAKDFVRGFTKALEEGMNCVFA